jgi:hypothetical protein
MDYHVGSAWHGPFETGCLGLLFGSWDVPRSRAAWPVASRDPLQIVSPFLPFESGGAIPGIGYSAPVVWLLVESVVSSLLGHNRWPTVPGVQDSDMLIGVNSLNIACEGLLLGTRAGGLEPKVPLTSPRTRRFAIFERA